MGAQDKKKVHRVSMGRRVPLHSLFEADAMSLRAMRLAQIAVGVVVVALVPVGAHAQSARNWNNKGQAAELREDYDAAYEDYRQAHLKAPADIRYKTRYERLRFLAATSHIDRGRVLKQSGDIPAAISEFTRASSIDPSNQTATQELNILLHPDNLPPPPGAPPTPGDNSLEQTPYQAETLRTINSVAGPVQLQPVSNDPITLHAVEDTKFIYQAIGKVAGLNVLFDPDYQSKRIPVDLTSVSLTDALRIVGTLAGTFYKPVTSNTIFVAQNSRSKRTDLDELSVQTFYLTNIAQANDLNEILTTVRNILDPSVKIYSVASSGPECFDSAGHTGSAPAGAENYQRLGSCTVGGCGGCSGARSQSGPHEESRDYAASVDRVDTSGILYDYDELDEFHGYYDDGFNDLGIYAQYAWQPECDELRGVDYGRYAECATERLRYTYSAESAYSGDGWAKGNAEDRVEDSDCYGIL